MHERRPLRRSSDRSRHSSTAVGCSPQVVLGQQSLRSPAAQPSDVFHLECCCQRLLWPPRGRSVAMASVSTERHPDAEFFGHGCLRESASVGVRHLVTFWLTPSAGLLAPSRGATVFQRAASPAPPFVSSPTLNIRSRRSRSCSCIAKRWSIVVVPVSTVAGCRRSLVSSRMAPLGSPTTRSHRVTRCPPPAA